MAGTVPEASDAAAVPDSAAFEGFVEYLRSLGFRVGIDHVIKLHRVVASLDARTSPKDLELLLCPLFATNEDQQELFYNAFESYFSLFFGPLVKPPEPLPEVPRRSPTYWWAVPAAVVSILVIAPLLLLREGVSFNLQFGVPPLGNAPAVPGVLYGQFHFQIPTMEWLPWLAMAVSAALCLLWNLRPQWVLDQTPATLYNLGGGLSGLFDGAQLRKAALQLRSCRPSQAKALDIRGSIDSTIQAQGNLHYLYRPKPVAPEYLILIDSAGPRDHQAAVFAELARRLANENVHTSVWFYNGDPHFCFAENQREAAYLVELRSRYPDSVLVLMGVGAEMISAVAGEVARRIPAFEGWRRRILLTPTPAQTYPASTWQTMFETAPPTPAGLAAAVMAVERPHTIVSKPDWPVAAPWTGGAWQSLREHLGPRRFAWVCGCAIYPQLEWALTMRMGEAFLGPAAWELQNILAIAILPWFRSGVIPAHKRRALARRLSGLDRSKAAEVVRQYVAGAAPDTPGRSRGGRRVDLTVVRVDSARRLYRWLASHMRQTVIVRADQLALFRISRLFWARLLRLAMAVLIGGLAWMVFERWPNPHRDVTMNVPLPNPVPTPPSASEQVPPASPVGVGQPTTEPVTPPPPTRPFQVPRAPALAAGPPPEIPPPPSIGTTAVVPSTNLLPDSMVPAAPLPQRPRSISSLLGAAVQLKYNDAKLYRFTDLGALPPDVQKLFANTAPGKDSVAAYNRMRAQPAELAYLLNNLAKARVVLPGGRELISYFTGINQGGYYSVVESDPDVLAALNQMVAVGTLSRESAAFRPGTTAVYVTRESGSDLRIGVRPTLGTGRLALELHIGEGQGLAGAVNTAIRAVRGIPSLISIYNRLLRQKLETGYRLGSACDLNGDGVTDDSDVQLIANQATSEAPAAVYDLNGDGVVNVMDVQLERAAVTSGSCPADIQLQPPTGVTVTVH